MELIELNAWADKLNVPGKKWNETDDDFRKRLLEQFQKPLRPRIVDRYCVEEWNIVEPSNGDQHWFYFYNDLSIELLTIRGNKK